MRAVGRLRMRRYRGVASMLSIPLGRIADGYTPSTAWWLPRLMGWEDLANRNKRRLRH
jgi:hypothetical protein